jgi:hypothetical protein
MRAKRPRRPRSTSRPSDVVASATSSIAPMTRSPHWSQVGLHAMHFSSCAGVLQKKFVTNCESILIGVAFTRARGTSRSRMQGCCPMATGRRIAHGVCAALLVATAMLLSLVPVRANPDCSPQDLANAVESAFNAFASSACASASSTGVGAGIATGLTGALFGISAGAGQNSVRDFCNAISSALNTTGDIQSDANTAQQILGSSSSALSSVASFVSDAASAGLDPLNIAACACTVEEGLEQAGSDLAGCACDIAATFLGSTCNCTPPPTQTADCASTIAVDASGGSGCGGFYDKDPACQGEGPNGLGTIIKTPSGTSPPVVQINGPNGTTVIQYGAIGACAPSWSCFCPKPMTWTWVCDASLDSNCTVNGEQIFACVCPSGTHADPSGKLVNGISVCLCDTTNQPADLRPDSFQMCPSCPTGEVQASATGKCVAPCAKNEVMTPDGTCCDPNKVTYCGQCCPPGMTPDPALGTCTNPSPIQ